MNHKEFLSSLPNEKRRQLQQKSDLRGLLHLLGHWGAIGVAGVLIALKIPFWPALLPLQGLLIVMVFTLMHECTHHTPFKTGWINTRVGQVCGLALALPFEWFRYFHFAHHRHTNDPDRDPELLGAGKPENIRQYAWYISGLPIWWSQFRTLFRLAGRGEIDDFIPAAARKRLRLEARIYLAIYSCVAVYILVYSSLPLFVWIIPVLLGQPFLRLFLLAEHGRCPPVANMFENSRTTFTTSLVRILTWNMPYHAEHHTMPNVPFHNLPGLHNLMGEYLKTTEYGYRRFHGTYIGEITADPTARR